MSECDCRYLPPQLDDARVECTHSQAVLVLLLSSFLGKAGGEEQALVNELMNMGFGEEACRNALSTKVAYLLRDVCLLPACSPCRPAFLFCPKCTYSKSSVLSFLHFPELGYAAGCRHAFVKLRGILQQPPSPIFRRKAG